MDPLASVGHMVDGIFVPTTFKEEHVRAAIRYRPRDGDLVLTTYPKCGTTWTQHIICHLFHYGKFSGQEKEMQEIFPFFDTNGLPGIDSAIAHASEVRGPACAKLHLPYNPETFNPKAKYVLVIRNPRDVCVSYFHHLRWRSGGNELSFEDFAKLFCGGRMWYGGYFDFMHSWFEGPAAKAVRSAASQEEANADDNDTNFLVLIYEKMKANPRRELLRIAQFLGGKPAQIVSDPKVVDDILEKTSVKGMREAFNPGFQQKLLQRSKTAYAHENGIEFVRKGVVGDWKTYFSEETENLFKQWIHSNPKNLNIMKLFE